MPNTSITLQGTIPETSKDLRLDQALSKLFPQYSRAQLQAWIRAGFVHHNTQIANSVRQKVKPGDHIQIEATLIENERWTAEPIALDIVFEDADMIVVNKPVGLVVHPGAGVSHHTLVNALLHHDATLNTLPRAGIIHRLDKNTSGLLIIARNLSSHHTLTQQMKARAIRREYKAIAKGILLQKGTVNAPIGRHPTQRTRMSVIPQGKTAITHYRILERFRKHTYLAVQLETGRTHQIRVHMQHIKHPILGDPVYGSHLGIPTQLSQSLTKALHDFKRQALHAAKLELTHPTTQERLQFEAPLPEDMQTLLTLLREDTHAPTP